MSSVSRIQATHWLLNHLLLVAAAAKKETARARSGGNTKSCTNTPYLRRVNAYGATRMCGCGVVKMMLRVKMSMRVSVLVGMWLSVRSVEAARK